MPSLDKMVVGWEGTRFNLDTCQNPKEPEASHGVLSECLKALAGKLEEQEGDDDEGNAEGSPT